MLTNFCIPGKQGLSRNQPPPFCVLENSLLQRASLPHRTEIKLPMTPCILWQDQGTDSPNSHSLSHKWLAELFVPISQNGWSMPINQTWPNFIQASFLPPSPWTLTYPWAMEGKQPLFNDPFQNKMPQGKMFPDQLSNHATHIQCSCLSVKKMSFSAWTLRCLLIS